MGSGDFNPNSVTAILAEIKTELRGMCNRLEELVSNQQNMERLHNERITKLENFRWWAAGGIGVLLLVIEYLNKS